MLYVDIVKEVGFLTFWLYNGVMAWCTWYNQKLLAVLKSKICCLLLGVCTSLCSLQYVGSSQKSGNNAFFIIPHSCNLRKKSQICMLTMLTEFQRSIN